MRNYPAYFRLLRDRLEAGRPAAQPLHHPAATTGGRRPGRSSTATSSPTASSSARARSSRAAQDQGLEVQHEENLREHYAATLRDWNRNLDEHWDECVAEVGEGTARVWRLYIAGSRIGFERDKVQLHQVLATRNHADGRSDFPMRPHW